VVGDVEGKGCILRWEAYPTRLPRVIGRSMETAGVVKIELGKPSCWKVVSECLML